MTELIAAEQKVEGEEEENPGYRREKLAAKVLPKTYIVEIDGEAAVVQACLSRLHEAEGLDDSESAGDKKGPLRVITSPAGTTWDISHRTNMGATPEIPTSYDKNSDAAFQTVRTDATVASSALMRLLKRTANSLTYHAFLEQQYESLRVQVTSQAQRIQELESQLEAAHNKIESFKDPSVAFQNYRHVWEKDHQDHQKSLMKGSENKTELLEHLLQVKRKADAQNEEVQARRDLLAQTKMKLNEEFGKEEDEASVFATVRRVFQPPPSVIQTTGGGTDENEEKNQNEEKFFGEEQVQQSPIDEMVAHSKTEEANNDEVSNEYIRGIHNLSIEEVLDRLEGGENQPECDRAGGSGKVPMEHRSSSYQQPLSLMGSLMKAFVNSSTTFCEIRIPFHQLAIMGGKSEELLQQASQYAISSLWNEASAYHDPIFYIVERPALDLHELQDVFVPQEDVVQFPLDGHYSQIQQESTKDPLAAREQRIIRRIKRLPEQFIEKEQREIMVAKGLEKQSQNICCKAGKGIIHWIARDFGKESVDNWKNPISGNYIRCYASSSLKPSRPDAIISPFSENPHYPFFMTEDKPGQHVDISFNNMVVMPTAYSIASNHPIQGGLYPRHWRIDASLDGLHWVTLRHHENDTSLSRYGPTATFELPKIIEEGNEGQQQRKFEYFQHFRLVHEGSNAVGTSVFCVCCFEVYGRVMYVGDGRPEPSWSLPAKSGISRVHGFTPIKELPLQAPPKAAPRKKKK